MKQPELDFFQKDELFHGYRIVRLLGQGGAGAVFLVRHEVLDTLYALKVLSPSAASQDAMQVKRFQREARLATHIRHPNLVTVHDCGYDEIKRLYYLVMDYVSGGSLRQALALEGPFTVERAVDVVTQVSQALQAAQPYNVVHRDIKPENIMLQTDGMVKLVDLGTAKAQNLGDSVRTTTESVFGTPAYVSPEQATSSANVDARADIYSLGIVFFEMLTGRLPYLGQNAAEILSQILSDEPTPDVRDIRPDLPENVAVLVRRMTMKELNRRLSSFDGVLRELARLGCARAAAPQPTVEFAPTPEVGMKTLLDGLVDNADEPQNKKSGSWGARLMARFWGGNSRWLRHFIPVTSLATIASFVCLDVAAWAKSG